MSQTQFNSGARNKSGTGLIHVTVGQLHGVAGVELKHDSCHGQGSENRQDENNDGTAT